jgi:ElaB/YqjD/DUF883 family membrane-anchored ribosome-binding protein
MNNIALTTRSPSEILEEFRALVTDAERLIGGSLAEDSTVVMDALRRRYEAVQAHLSGMVSGVRTRVTTGAAYTDSTIRGNLYPSLAVAAGVGVLVGVLLGRRGSR